MSQGLFTSQYLFQVGGMTELELGVELDLAGPELVLAVSRFRSNVNVASTCSTSHVSTSAETPSLHWKEIGMEKDVSYCSNSGQRFESCEDTPPEEYGEESSQTTSKKIMISNHFVDNDRKSKNKSEAENFEDTNAYNNERFTLNLVEEDNKIEDTNTYNNDGCTSNLVENDNNIEDTKSCIKDGCMPNPVENDNTFEDTKTCNKDGCMPNTVETSFNIDSSEQSNSVDDVTLTRLLQKLDFKVISYPHIMVFLVPSTIA